MTRAVWIGGWGVDPERLRPLAEALKYAGSLAGLLKGVSDPEVKTHTTDYFGSVTDSDTFQDYEVHQATGQAKLMSVKTVRPLCGLPKSTRMKRPMNL